MTVDEIVCTIKIEGLDQLHREGGEQAEYNQRTGKVPDTTMYRSKTERGSMAWFCN